MTWEVRCGDALEEMRAMRPGSVDAVVTDPPYFQTGDAAIASSRSFRAVPETQFFVAWLREHFAEWIRVTRSTGVLWLTLDWRGCLVLDDVAARAGVRRAPAIGVWSKKRIGMGGMMRRSYETFAVLALNDFEYTPTGEPDLWEIPWGGGKALDHPAEKPVALMERALRLALPRGGTVLDPFCGSGTTAVAASHIPGVSFIGIEREAEYVEVARRRIAGPLFADGAVG